MAAAACLLLALSGSAGANRLSVNSQSMRWTFTEFSSNNAGINIRCAVTLEGSFHSRTIAKVRGALIGSINRASVRSGCAGEWGDMVFLAESLPWHLRYRSFAGTLPRITSVSTDIVGFAWSYPGLGRGPCLYRSTAERPAGFILNLGAEGGARSVTADPTTPVPLVSGLLCAETINYAGTGAVTQVGSTSAVSVTLI
jgi:hypothetical protein